MVSGCKYSFFMAMNIVADAKIWRNDSSTLTIIPDF